MGSNGVKRTGTGCLQGKAAGFTLAELLMALLILGVIATFTIPKVLSSQQDNSYKAKAKEVAAMVSEAYVVYKANNTAGANTGIQHLTPYMNYVKMNSSGFLNERPTAWWGDVWCGTYMCLDLHNGGRMSYDPTVTFGGTAATNAVWFNLDPDSGRDVDGSGVAFMLYYNGRLKTAKDWDANTCTSTFCQGGEPTGDPAWFNWN